MLNYKKTLKDTDDGVLQSGSQNLWTMFIVCD